MWPVRVFSPGRSPRWSPKPVAACVRGRGLLGSDQKHLQPLPAPGSLRPRQPAGSVVGSGWWPGPPCPGAAAHQLTLFAFKLVVKLSCGTIRPEKPKECAGPGFLFGERLSVNSAGIPAGSVGSCKHCHSLLSTWPLPLSLLITYKTVPGSCPPRSASGSSGQPGGEPDGRAQVQSVAAQASQHSGVKRVLAPSLFPHHWIVT